MRFEIIRRDGLARLGKLEMDGAEHRTPTMAFVDTWKHKAPKDHLKLRRSGLAKAEDIGVAASMYSQSADSGATRIEVGYRGSPFADDFTKGCFAIPESISELMLNSRRYADEVDAIKSSAELVKPAFCPVAGLPSRLAFLSYCGMDIFDSIPIIMATENDLYLTTDGAIPVDKIDELPCDCVTCTEGVTDREGLLAHNTSTAISEFKRIRHHISHGTLRGLVESRVRSDPWQVQSLRLLDLEHASLQELHAPIKGARFVATSKESLHRPDVVRWRSRLTSRYMRPERADILLLIPCSAKKPYSISSSHRRFREAIRISGASYAVHEVIVTSPLGLVPRELELFYPAKDYDIPVTGHWDGDERGMVQDMIRWLIESQRYRVVISHLGDERDLVDEVLADRIDTSDGRPGSRDSLERLEEAIREYAPSKEFGTEAKRRSIEDLASISRFQFGKSGDGLTDGARAVGRWPGTKILKGEVQQGAMSYPRGMISLTLAGGEVIASSNAYCVEIDDFVPKGNLFAVGVEDATDDIRVGDDVVVKHENDVKAVGVARMSPLEMRIAQRGEAVHIRHCAK